MRFCCSSEQGCVNEVMKQPEVENNCDDEEGGLLLHCQPPGEEHLRFRGIRPLQIVLNIPTVSEDVLQFVGEILKNGSADLSLFKKCFQRNIYLSDFHFQYITGTR